MKNTEKSRCVLSPWLETNYTHSQMQLYLGTTELSKIELIAMLGINNLSAHSLNYTRLNRPEKYNPKVYFRILQTTSRSALDNYDTKTYGSTWPESFVIKI